MGRFYIWLGEKWDLNCRYLSFSLFPQSRKALSSMRAMSSWISSSELMSSTQARSCTIRCRRAVWPTELVLLTLTERSRDNTEVSQSGKDEELYSLSISLTNYLTTQQSLTSHHKPLRANRNQDPQGNPEGQLPLGGVKPWAFLTQGKFRETENYKEGIHSLKRLNSQSF